jgi:hypothetical protein
MNSGAPNTMAHITTGIVIDGYRQYKTVETQGVKGIRKELGKNRAKCMTA